MTSRDDILSCPTCGWKVEQGICYRCLFNDDPRCLVKGNTKTCSACKKIFVSLAPDTKYCGKFCRELYKALKRRNLTYDEYFSLPPHKRRINPPPPKTPPAEPVNLPPLLLR
jgi:hypothetical protein